jgi:uncharacterized protein (TIGR02596 family)
MRSTTRFSPARAAFTLIELLVVITVISLLLAFSAPALFNGLQASRLSSSGERMVSALSEAQQIAFSQNCVVEIQFYSFRGDFGSGPAFRAYRLFRITTPTTGGSSTETVTSIGSIVRLPDGVMISADTGLSPALTAATFEDTFENSGVTDAEYAALRFLPDGTCRRKASSGAGLAVLDFPTLRESYFTMVEDDGRTYSANTLPNNFYTIQTDPFTGKSRSYRPGF